MAAPLNDWQALQLSALSAHSWRVCGLQGGRARCLVLTRTAAGAWAIQEQGHLSHQQPGGMASVAPSAAASVEQAPMEGVLMELALKVGQHVQAGERLYLLEAMKMQLEIKAPQAGQIRALLAKQGQSLRRGQPILKLEETP